MGFSDEVKIFVTQRFRHWDRCPEMIRINTKQDVMYKLKLNRIDPNPNTIGKFGLSFLFAVLFLSSNAQINALYFDGSDDYVSIGHQEVFNVDQVSVELWFYWESKSSTATQFVTGKGLEQLEIHTGYQDESLQYVSDALRFILTPGVYLDTEAISISRNRWNHIAFVYDPANSYYYGK